MATYYDQHVGKTFIDGEQLLFDHLEKKAMESGGKQADFLRSLSNLEKIQFENLIWSWSAKITQYAVPCTNVMEEAERWAAAQIDLQRKHGIGVEFRHELNKLISKLQSKGSNNDRNEIRKAVEGTTTETLQERTTGSETPRSDHQVSNDAPVVRNQDQLKPTDGGRTTDPVVHTSEWNFFGL